MSLLLLAIAVDGVRVLVQNEDPQRGSAFAMFAAVDFGTSREVLATAPGHPTIILDIPDTLGEVREGVVAVPSENRARGLAGQLAALTWEVEVGEATATVGGTVTFSEVRVQVVGLDVQGRNLTRQILTDVSTTESDP